MLRQRLQARAAQLTPRKKVRGRWAERDAQGNEKNEAGRHEEQADPAPRGEPLGRWRRTGVVGGFVPPPLAGRERGGGTSEVRCARRQERGGGPGAARPLPVRRSIHRRRDPAFGEARRTPPWLRAVGPIVAWECERTRRGRAAARGRARGTSAPACAVFRPRSPAERGGGAR